MSEKKKCECKKLCIECKHYAKVLDKSYDIRFYSELEKEACQNYAKKEICRIYEKKTKSCINGDETVVEALCIDYNADGNCKKWEPLPNAELKNMLIEFIAKEKKGATFYRPTILVFLAQELLKTLNGEKSKLFEGVFTANDPFCYSIVVTKYAINESINSRNSRLSYQKDGDAYADPHLSEEDYKKEKSWLDAVKKLLKIIRD